MSENSIEPTKTREAADDASRDTAAPTLSPLRERFCRYYLTEPSATRAAVKAGYSERTAPQQASRLLSSVNILQRIDAIRRSEHLVYELSPQAVMDRCEAIFEEALEKGRYEAAIGALRLQARIGGLLRPDAPPATKQDLAGVVEHCVRTAVSRYVAFGTLGALNPLTPPPWVPGEEAARRQRRKMEKELGAEADGRETAARAESYRRTNESTDRAHAAEKPSPACGERLDGREAAQELPTPSPLADPHLTSPASGGRTRAPDNARRNMRLRESAAAAPADADAETPADVAARARAGWPPREGTLAWPHDEASMYCAAVGHDDDHYRAMGLAPATPRLPDCAPPEAHAERERAYALGRTPHTDAPLAREFPPEDDGDAPR